MKTGESCSVLLDASPVVESTQEHQCVGHIPQEPTAVLTVCKLGPNFAVTKICIGIFTVWDCPRILLLETKRKQPTKGMCFIFDHFYYEFLLSSVI